MKSQTVRCRSPRHGTSANSTAYHNSKTTSCANLCLALETRKLINLPWWRRTRWKNVTLCLNVLSSLSLLGTCVAEAYVHGAGPPSPSTTWEELPDFYLDLIDAMREVDSNASLVVGDFLFSDQDGKKRSTVLRRYMGCDGTNDSSVGVTDP